MQQNRNIGITLVIWSEKYRTVLWNFFKNYNIKLRKYGQSIDLGVYADYSIINAYKNTADPVGKVITVTPPSSSSAAIVDVHPLSTAYSNKFGFMNVGLKVAFNFDTNYFFN